VILATAAAVLEQLTEKGSGSGWGADGCGLAEIRVALHG
jgi:hypothetical protein